MPTRRNSTATATASRRAPTVDANGMTFARADADELKSLLSSGTKPEGGTRARSKLGTVRNRAIAIERVGVETTTTTRETTRETTAAAAARAEIARGTRGVDAVGATRGTAARANARETDARGLTNDGRAQGSQTAMDVARMEAREEEAMRAMMLERQPSLRSIKTKVEERGRDARGGDEKRADEGAQASGSARYRANGGRAMGRGVNFDKDGNTPRSGGDGEMLGSIDSGTPNFFRDAKALKDDAVGGRAVHAGYTAYATVVRDTPGAADSTYFNNTELADLLMIVHGRQSGDNETPRTAKALNTPTLAEVNVLSTAPMNYWERRSGDMREMSPEISIEGDEKYVGKKRKSCKKRPKSETKARRFSAELLTREELAIRKMKAFSTRGSTLRTVDDEDLVRTLVDVNGHPLSQEMKNACLEYNAKTTELNERHETEMASKSLIREVSADGAVEPKSRTWTHEEDALVRQLVDEHGPQKWAYIAERLVGKTQKQVYARWRDYLQPGLTTRPWAEFEEKHLVFIQEAIGNQWAVLARLMPGRSPNAIKNRFHATRRKCERADELVDKFA